MVYSTDPDFDFSTPDEEVEELPPEAQPLRIRLDRKGRKGKEVTLVSGFVGPEGRLQELGKWLKGQCGTGGSVKEGEILLQGDHREKVLQLLLKNGYAKTRKQG
ncbi:MAG: translation initiation factor [Bacteroidetes bacterium]|nr:MAG: translation initiation factor [Bacteroidota bacterium]